jgi:hypothetical protein
MKEKKERKNQQGKSTKRELDNSKMMATTIYSMKR